MKSSIGMLACVFGLFLAGAANATTLVESDVAGGEYSANLRAPAVAAFEFGAVAGIGGGVSDDHLLFTGLSSGAQSLSRSVDTAFSGSLHVARNFTHGADLTYSNLALSNAFPQMTNRAEAPAAVATSSEAPVSSALLLLGSGLLGLFYVGKAHEGEYPRLSALSGRRKGLPMGLERGTADPSLRARRLGVADPARLSRGRGVGRPAPSPLLTSRTARSTMSPREFSRSSAPFSARVGAPGHARSATIIVLADVR